MPNIETQQSPSLRPKIELAILLVLLAIIVGLLWYVTPQSTHDKITAFPRTLVSALQRVMPGKTAAPSAQPVSDASTSPTPKPTIIPLPSGLQSYRFSNSEGVAGPKITRLTLDPLTPQPGSTQTLTLLAGHTSAIKEVKVEIITDNETKTQVLKRTDGDDTNGTWQGSWVIKDSYDYRYGFRLILNGGDSTYDNTMWFRRNSL